MKIELKFVRWRGWLGVNLHVVAISPFSVAKPERFGVPSCLAHIVILPPVHLLVVTQDFFVPVGRSSLGPLT